MTSDLTFDILDRPSQVCFVTSYNYSTASLRHLLLVLTPLVACSGLAFAADINKANNTTNLNSGASWQLGVAPGSNDVAVWTDTVTGANTIALGGSIELYGDSRARHCSYAYILACGACCSPSQPEVLPAKETQSAKLARVFF